MGKTSKDSVLRSVRVPADVDELLVEVAEREDRSISYVIVKALERLVVPALPARASKPSAEDMAGVDISKAVVKVPKPKPVSKDVQRDANAEYARMMAERQARLQKGRE
jgi:predicted transcriptional regulator